MKYTLLFSAFILGSLPSPLLASLFASSRVTRKKTPLHVRVLLDEKAADGELWVLKNAHGFLLSDGNDPKRQHFIKENKLIIGCSSSLTLNGKRITTDWLKIDTAQGHIAYGQNEYKGSFFVRKKDGKAQLVNRIELEDYVASGVRWEMLPRWKKAALEAGAITYRTYAVWTIQRTRAQAKKKKRDEGYDIRCTNVHQVYKGHHACACIHDAVKSTAGLILTHSKGTVVEPIIALYDACCGGSIPGYRCGMDFEKAA